MFLATEEQGSKFKFFFCTSLPQFTSRLLRPGLYGEKLLRVDSVKVRQSDRAPVLFLDNQSMRKRCWLGQRGQLFSHIK